MATLFLGQMARFVGHEWIGPASRNPRGMACRIIGSQPVCNEGRLWDWYVEFAPGRCAYADSYELEPILPDGHRAGTESFQELMDRLNTEKVERVEEAAA